MLEALPQVFGSSSRCNLSAQADHIAAEACNLDSFLVETVAADRSHRMACHSRSEFACHTLAESENLVLGSSIVPWES